MPKSGHKKEEDNLFIYGFYTKLLNNEKHNIVIQAKLRKLAIYWLLVIFAGIGIIFSSKEVAIPVQRFIPAAIFCVIGIIGNIILWYEDLIIQERFLNTNFFEAFRLENMHKWLPQIHTNFTAFAKVVFRAKLHFYIFCNAIFISSLFVLILNKLLKFEWYYFLIFAIFMLISFFIITKLMFVKTYRNHLLVMKEFAYDRR